METGLIDIQTLLEVIEYAQNNCSTTKMGVRSYGNGYFSYRSRGETVVLTVFQVYDDLCYFGINQIKMVTLHFITSNKCTTFMLII
jgi:hypothetical protein